MEVPPANGDGEDPEVLTLAGMALYHAQVLEVALTNLAVALYASKQGSFLKSEIVAKFDRFEKKTLGQLLEEVRKHTSLDNETEAWLIGLLDTRNNIAHRFFRTHDSAMLEPRGRKLMADELREMIDELRRGHLAVEEIYRPLWAAFGVTEERMLSELAEMKRESDNLPRAN